jgi:uncharacterized caspase-like protein
MVLYAQESDYETWSRGKAREYAKWRKLRAETDHLLTSPEQEEVSSFIDAGFGQAPESGTHHRPPSTAAPAIPAAPNAPDVPDVPDVPEAARKMRVWVVVAGVADYRTIDGLNYTDDDAYRMYAFYKSPEGGSLPDSQIRVLIDEDATRNNVLQAMNDIYSRATSGDAIMFYFSGHGARDAFITQEYDGHAVDRRGLLLHQEIQAQFDRSPAKYKYVIADACHSGSWVTQSHPNNASTGGAYYHTFENSGGGSVLMLSSMGDEYSLESSGIRQGVFSHFLIRGLKGEADTNGDRAITVVELFDFVRQHVIRSTEHRQTPVLSGDYKSHPPISILRKD